MVTSATAPAKIILCGEHAVVYGIPAIAAPVFGLQAIATVQPRKGDFLLVAEDLGQTFSLQDTASPLIRAALLVQEAYSVNLADIRLQVRSTIPIGSGLGSGAAVTTAIIKSLLQSSDIVFDYAKINELVYIIEQHHHGTPSGIDNTVIVYEKPILFTKGHPFELIRPGGRFCFVIADTGIEASTKQTVAHVKSLHEASPNTVQSIFDGIHDIVKQTRHALINGDVKQLGEQLTQNHALLQRLEVSVPRLDQLVSAALDSGAYGAKLSGGGGGGNMIALVSPELTTDVQQALMAAGAVNTYTTELNAHDSDTH